MNQKAPPVHGEVLLIDPSGSVGPELRKSIAPEALANRSMSAAQAAQSRMPAAVRELSRTSRKPLDSLMREVPALTLVEKDAAVGQGTAWLSQSGGPELRRLALIVIHPDAVNPTGEHAAYGTYDLFKPASLDESTEDAIKDSVREAIVAVRLSRENLDRKTIDALVNVDAPFTRVVAADGKVDEANPALNRVIPYMLLVFLMVGAYSGGTSLLSTTVEEKFNRVMEVLLSAVTPFELMVGKILGQLAVSGLVMAFYVGAGMLVLSSFALFGLVQPILLLYLLLFFVTTYLIVGALMGAVGAAVNDLRDAQTLLMPLNIVLFLPWLLAIPILRNPHSTLSVVLSFIPPMNGFATLLRLSSGSPPPTWQVGLSLVASLVAAFIALWFASKIFRIALLIQGKPPNLATFIRWARAA